MYLLTIERNSNQRFKLQFLKAGRFEDDHEHFSLYEQLICHRLVYEQTVVMQWEEATPPPEKMIQAATSLLLRGFVKSYHLETEVRNPQQGSSIFAPVRETFLPLELIGSGGQRLGLWYYSTSYGSDMQSHPIGYCAQHCPGHKTPQEACNHYAAYLRDRMRVYDGKSELPCEVCGKLTKSYAECFESKIAQRWPLCPLHYEDKALKRQLQITITPETGIDISFRRITRYKVELKQEEEA